jgi:hypothetical protein
MSEFLCKSEIRDFDVAFLVDQQVLRFEIPVNDVLIVHVANGQQNFANVKHTDIVAEPSVFSQSIEKLTPSTVLKDHVNENVVLEGGFQGVNERMVEFCEDLFL